jgi:hypothetical protein
MVFFMIYTDLTMYKNESSLNAFLTRLQDRLTRQLHLIAETITASSATASAQRRTPNRAFGIGLHLRPAAVARSLQYLGMAITAMALTFWLLQWWQLPSIPDLAPSSLSPSSIAASNKSNSGVTLYANQDSTAAYDLFGSKPVMLDALFLRGIVATGKNSNGSLNGFAIFEVDGKPTNAIGIDESLGKGLTLQSIGDESATLLYQGQQIQFKLSKPSNHKAIATQKK